MSSDLKIYNTPVLKSNATAIAIVIGKALRQLAFPYLYIFIQYEIQMDTRNCDILKYNHIYVKVIYKTMEVLSGVFTSVVVQKEHGIGDFLVTFYFSVLMSIINLL